MYVQYIIIHFMIYILLSLKFVYVFQSLVAAGFVCQIIVRELVKTGKNLPLEGDRVASDFTVHARPVRAKK